MKRGNSIWLNIIFFLLGSLTCYILCQYKCLEIDKKVNITTALISIITAAIGLFLAISIKKYQSKSSNLHNYLQPKLDASWNLFLNLSHKVSLNDQIELNVVNKSIKEISLNLAPLKKMFASFGLNNPCLDKLETAIEDFEKFMVACPVKKNIIQYKDKKNEIRIKLDEIHSLFVHSLKEINKIS